MYEGYEALRVERKGAVLWVTMREVPGMDEEMWSVFREISADRETRCVVLTGEDRSFCVGKGGAALDEKEKNAHWVRNMPGARELITSILECDKPVIARINGHAVGKGCSIALACDFTIMVDKAKIGDTHVKLGLVAGDGGTLLWPHLLGWMQCKRWLLTGDLLTGREAADIGLITMAVAPEELDEKVEYWAQRMANGATRAISLTKRAINLEMRQQAQAHMDMSLGFETQSFLTEDYKEGLDAMLTKRDATFTGN